VSVYNKVVWSEGLFLRPHHFQQQDRYFERYVETRCQALVPHSWGFTELEIERDLLSIGKFGLRRAAASSDGTPVRMPDDDRRRRRRHRCTGSRSVLYLVASPVAGAADVDRVSADGLARHDARLRRDVVGLE
jgi:type VI secretion system protein ImpJ